MRVTSVKQQAKRNNRYSIFVDDKYTFSLSESALIESKLASGQELTSEQIADYKKLSTDDKIYHRALRYVAIRPRSRWEVEFYLQRKNAEPPLIENILNKLSDVQLLDDEKFAQSFVHDRRLLRSMSKRKLTAELKKKRISEDIIQRVLEDEHDDTIMLKELIERKRRQSKYQDDTKLMQYLARQGFNYGDIKSALSEEVET